MISKSRKEIAAEFLTLCAIGKSHKAFDLFVGENFIHHNTYFKGDRETLMLAMEANAKQNPHKILEIKHTLEDGSLAAVHSHVRQNPNDLGVAVIHIFCFENDKIVELWDFGQPVPQNLINENGMF